MKVTVDVHRAEQVYDLDTGVQKNIVVFELGGVEHRVEVSEEELEAVLMDTMSRARIHYADEEEPESEKFNFNDNGDHFTVDPSKLAELQQQSSFEIGQVFPEERARIEVPEGTPSIHLQGDDSSQRTDGVDQPLLNQRHVEQTPREQRNESIQERRQQDPAVQRKKLAKDLRQRARQTPRRRLSPDQVDEAGNPVVEQAKAPPESHPEGPEVGYNDAGVPNVAGVEDDDGFPSA